MTILFGDPRMPTRFWSRISINTAKGCWEMGNGGYASFSLKGISTKRAHRVSYLTLVGPFEDELVLDHLCRNPPCVNPAHLEPVTSAENILRGTGFSARNARKTHCSKGHEFSPENLDPRKLPQRVCKICADARWERHQARMSEHMSDMHEYGY